MKKIASCLISLSLCFTFTACSTAPHAPTANVNTQEILPKHDRFTLESRLLKETRTIHVWTPDSYHTQTQSLPVLYMLDGGLKEDFPHLAHTLAQLIQDKKIPPIILVGIENTQRRRDMTGTTEDPQDQSIAPIVGESAQFRAFIDEELFKEITQRYRTTQEKGLIGESLAGLFVTETLLLQPDMFDFYIAFDPSLWWNKKHLIRHTPHYFNQNFSKLPMKTKRYWFSASQVAQPVLQEMSQSLINAYTKSLIWHFSTNLQAKHDTIYRLEKEKALIWIFNPQTQSLQKLP